MFIRKDIVCVNYVLSFPLENSCVTDSVMSCEDKFNAAVSVIRNLPKNGSYQPSNELMLRFYGYYKQATEGPATGPRPAFWDVVKRAKWDAWARLGTMARHQAMQAYVDELNKIVETMAFTDNVADFLTSVDSFTNSVPVEDLELCIGPALEKVRSLPGSPLANTPLGSRDTSPVRGRVSSPGPVEQEEEDDDFLDSMDQTEPEPRNKELWKKSIKMNGGINIPQTDIKLPNGYIENRRHTNADSVSDTLHRTVENLHRDLAITNSRIQALEFHFSKKRTNSFGGLTKEAIIFIVIWPLISYFLINRLTRRN